MTLVLDDPEADRLAHEIADLTGETLTVAVRTSLADRLHAERIKRQRAATDRAAIDALLAEFDALPVLDYRRADEIIGYDENGLPT